MPFFNKDTIDQKIEKNEIALKKLITDIERLELETAKTFEDLGITQDQFVNYLENPEHFTESEWNDLEEHKKKLNQKLDLSINHINDPCKAAKTRADMRLSQNWLFVR